MNNDSLEKLIPLFVPILIFIGTLCLVDLATIAVTDTLILKREVEGKAETFFYLLPFLLVYGFFIYYGVKNLNYFKKRNLKHFLLLIILPGFLGLYLGYSIHLKRTSIIHKGAQQQMIENKIAVNTANGHKV